MYSEAREVYAKYGIDTEKVLETAPGELKELYEQVFLQL